MNTQNFKKSLTIIIISIIILFVLYFIGDVIIGGKGANLCSIFFGCTFVILGLFYISFIILLKKFGIKIKAKILSYERIRKNPFRKRCNITYNIDGINYSNWVICKSDIQDYDKPDEISILVLKKYPKIAISKYQNSFFIIIVMLLILIVGLFIIFKNI